MSDPGIINKQFIARVWGESSVWQRGVTAAIAFVVLALIIALAVAIPQHMKDIGRLEERIKALEKHHEEAKAETEGFENGVSTQAELLGKNRQDRYALNMTLGNIDANQYVEFTQPGRESRALPLPNGSIAMM